MTNTITVLHAPTFTLTSSLKSPVAAVVAVVLVEIVVLVLVLILVLVLVLVLAVAVAVVLVALTYNQLNSYLIFGYARLLHW